MTTIYWKILFGYHCDVTRESKYAMCLGFYCETRPLLTAQTMEPKMIFLWKGLFTGGWHAGYTDSAKLKQNGLSLLILFLVIGNNRFYKSRRSQLPQIYFMSTSHMTHLGQSCNLCALRTQALVDGSEISSSIFNNGQSTKNAIWTKIRSFLCDFLRCACWWPSSILKL